MKTKTNTIPQRTKLQDTRIQFLDHAINYFANLRMSFRQNFFFKTGLETNLE